MEETVVSCDPPAQELPYQNNVEVFTEQTDEASPSERMSLSALKRALQRQLEYYFSRENLSTDEYLISQMDSENYVAISTVAKFNQVRRLTDDHNLVVEVLRESALVQVDDSGEKVRPSPRSGVLILREIPESTPTKELEGLFSGEECPKFLRCEYANNNTWYVLFESDEDTQRAYQYLREANVTFHGKPVRARIKSKAVTSAPFTSSYKNGPQDQQAAAPQAPPDFSAQPSVSQQPQPPLQYTYSNVPSESYTNQQVCPPFYPPTMLQAWAPTTPAVDLGTVLSVNGLSPQAAYRPLNSNTNRHNFSSSDSQRYLSQQRSSQSYVQQRSQQQQQLHPSQQSFPNLVNTFDYVPYSTPRSSRSFMDMNFFTAPNLYYNKVPMYNRHNPVLVPQQPNYASAYAKETKEVKENWAPNQRQRGKRWFKENGSVGSSRSYPESTSGGKPSESESKSESPKFDLETTSFPPLPGCMETDIIDVEVYESRLSDIVKGTVKVVPTPKEEIPAPSLPTSSEVVTTNEPSATTQPVVAASDDPPEPQTATPSSEETDPLPAATANPSISDSVVANGSSNEEKQLPVPSSEEGPKPPRPPPKKGPKGGGVAKRKEEKKPPEAAVVVAGSSSSSLNGHAADSDAHSSEDEKHQSHRKLTYSEVAMRAKEKVEKIAQEHKERPPPTTTSGPRVAARTPTSKEWRKPPLST